MASELDDVEVIEYSVPSEEISVMLKLSAKSNFPMCDRCPMEQNFIAAGRANNSVHPAYNQNTMKAPHRTSRAG